MPTAIGVCIKYEMALSGIDSQAELCQKAGVSISALSAVMTGKTKHPDVWTIVRIADALKCPVDRLVNPDAEYVWSISSHEQRLVDCYRNGSKKLRKLLDLVVEWDAEERPGAFCPNCEAPTAANKHWPHCSEHKSIAEISDVDALWRELDKPGRYLAADLSLESGNLFYIVGQFYENSVGVRRNDQVAKLLFSFTEDDFLKARSEGLLVDGPFCSTWVRPTFSKHLATN